MWLVVCFWVPVKSARAVKRQAWRLEKVQSRPALAPTSAINPGPGKSWLLSIL